MPAITYATDYIASPPRKIFTYDSQAFLPFAVAHDGPTTVIEAVGYNKSGGQRWFHLFNAATAQPNGTTPSVMPVPVPAGATFSFTYPAGGVVFNAGVFWACSTTDSPLTVTVGNDMWVMIARK